MPVDWAATGSWMEAWAGFAGAGAVVYAAAAGTRAYKGWLRQKQAERRLLVAERVVTLAKRLKRAFGSIRSPLLLGHELEAAAAKLLEADGTFAHLDRKEQDRLRTAQVILMRISYHEDDWNELDACLPLTSAYLGPKVEAALEELIQQRVNVQFAAEEYAHSDGGDRKRDVELRREFAQNRGSNGKETDAVSAAVEKAIASIETAAMPYLHSELDQPEAKRSDGSEG